MRVLFCALSAVQRGRRVDVGLIDVLEGELCGCVADSSLRLGFGGVRVFVS